jgi:hypothetical protein
LDQIRLAASEVDNGIYGGALVDVGEVLHRMLLSVLPGGR